METVDLRSDLLTRPTAAMMEAMASAGRRAPAFGLREDPDQRALEGEVAALLGHEDALLFPTCSMANLVGLMLLASPGEVVLAQPESHVITSEAGGAAAIGGLLLQSVGVPMPCPDPDAWRERMRGPTDVLNPKVAALSLENTHNRAGGLAWPVDYGTQLLELARSRGLGAHLDGSRLFNAAVALGCEPRHIASRFDTVSVSLNKALGAPVGAALAASASLVERAVLLRQRLGGGLRPTGMLAAAARVAIVDREHLADDHRRRGALALQLASLADVCVVPCETPTNILLVDVMGSAAIAVDALARRGVRVLAAGTRRLRLVFYRGIDDAAVARVASAFAACADAGGFAPTH